MSAPREPESITRICSSISDLTETIDAARRLGLRYLSVSTTVEREPINDTATVRYRADFSIVEFPS